MLIVTQRATGVLPQDVLPKLLGDLVDLAPGPGLSQEARGPEAMLEEVERFRTDSVGGKFYEGFNVNSGNCNEQSRGTDGFIAPFDRLAVRCVSAAESAPCHAVAQAFEVLFDLLRVIGEGHDDVLFFADEGGSWDVGVDWRKVLPA